MARVGGGYTAKLAPAARGVTSCRHHCKRQQRASLERERVLIGGCAGLCGCIGCHAAAARRDLAQETRRRGGGGEAQQRKIQTPQAQAAWPTWFKYQAATVDVIYCSWRVVAMARHTTITYHRSSPPAYTSVVAARRVAVDMAFFSAAACSLAPGRPSAQAVAVSR
ncbi:hypothetical protein COCCADRAFT_30958 [Bipolaris zeicola 26-R-13]|uniref:Uncharacterized protein n=1 Tax=Cochliobolus carbonum (strain 26-R-13) TaxID=930089 RepID=W6Y955_COCC2|nr:uncharacterized protein COCCADRAFT_30958 [Bipolaris zeicola 26-R-13]EUC27591.1 hypothetical protein COCCADRAFT_30958 [Bipolaris zeicola 26-R-13]